LDIGCNTGLLTSTISRYFFPKSITGIDIDEKLIGIANNHLKTEKSKLIQKKMANFFSSEFWRTG